MNPLFENIERACAMSSMEHKFISQPQKDFLHLKANTGDIHQEDPNTHYPHQQRCCGSCRLDEGMGCSKHSTSTSHLGLNESRLTPDEILFLGPAMPCASRAERALHSRMRKFHRDALFPKRPKPSRQSVSCLDEGFLARRWLMWLSVHPRIHVLLLHIYAYLPFDSSNKRAVRNRPKLMKAWRLRQQRLNERLPQQGATVSGK